jgi:hypothetical protein
MIGAYIDWREACRAVNDAYRSWAGAAGPDIAVAFLQYNAALDVEERTAKVYAGLTTRVADLVAPVSRANHPRRCPDAEPLQRDGK